MSTPQPFDLMVDEHGPTVLRVCRVVLGFHPDAEDAWSETFLAALRAWPDLDAGANVEAWLVTIAHRKCLDVIRRRSRHAVPVAAVPEEAGPPESGPDVDTDLADVRQAVAALPDKQRHAVAYHYLADLSYREVAAILGGTEAAARRAAADGMRTLRRHYRTGGTA